MLEYQYIKTFLLKDILQFGLKKFFVIKGVKNAVPWTNVINDLNCEGIIRTFYEKELQKSKSTRILDRKSH